MARILVVEDEPKVLAGLVRGLRDAGHDALGVVTGEEALTGIARETFDGLVLDLMLPGRGGLEVLAELRRAGNAVPVLVLTARDAVEDRVVGLDTGADDYLVKPFAFAELLARLRVLLRRGQPERETVLRADDLEVDLLQRRVTRGGEEISLGDRKSTRLNSSH